jgi:hypothetical protein
MEMEMEEEASMVEETGMLDREVEGGALFRGKGI